MADIVLQKNVGALIAIATSVEPQSSAAATVNGASIDRLVHGLALSCVLHQQVGADSGAPSALSVAGTLQHSPDNSTWTNYLPDGVTVQTATVTAVNSEASVNVDLTAAYRYLRIVTIVSFTGGTSPAALIAAELVVAGENTLAAV